MNHITTKAIILKRLDFSEADRILTVLTADHGQVSLLAKGVRRPKSKLAGGLELFSVSDVTYIEGRSDLKTVISTRLDVHYRRIVTNVHATMLAYEMLKYIVSYTEHTSSPVYFDLLQRALAGLDTSPESPEPVYLWFCVRLLTEAGNGINLEKPLDGPSFQDDKSYNFSLEDMSFISHQNGQFQPNHIKFLRLVMRAENPEQLTVIAGHMQLATELAQTFTQIMTINRA